eukprot:scaffold12553_cov76-Cylindrotheca_fusiformis.AAC.2
MPAMTSSCQSGFARGTRVKRVAGAALVRFHAQARHHTNAVTAFRRSHITRFLVLVWPPTAKALQYITDQHS